MSQWWKSISNDWCQLDTVPYCSKIHLNWFKRLTSSCSSKVLCSAGTPTVSKGWSTSSITFLIGTSLVWVRTATRFGCPVRSSSEQTMWINWRCCRLAMQRSCTVRSLLIDRIHSILSNFIVYSNCFPQGGNNTFCKWPHHWFFKESQNFAANQPQSHPGECFFFGVIQIIFGIFGDQICNAKRIEESGYGYRINSRNYTQEVLASTIHRALNDVELKYKLRKASERIQRDNEIGSIGSKVMNYLNNQWDRFSLEAILR